jgi:hypothetical protein
MEALSNQVVVSAIGVWLVQRLKQAPWFPWVRQQSDRAQRAAAVMVALLATAGIHVTFESEAGVLTVTGLTLANFAHFLWHALKTFVFQELVYRAGVKQ